MNSNQSIQIQQLPQHPKSAKGLNNGIPVFTHERAEERAAATKKTNQNVNKALIFIRRKQDKALQDRFIDPRIKFFK